MNAAAFDGMELRSAIRGFLQAESDSTAVRAMLGEDGARRTALWRHVASLGWLGLNIDERHGGLGLGLGAVALVYEELGRALTPVALLPAQLAAQAIGTAGDAAQQAAWLPRIATGELRFAAALAQSSGTLQARTVAGGWEVSGQLAHVLAEDSAGWLLVPVRGPAAEEALALVACGAAGLAVRERATVDRTRTLWDARFEAVSVPAAQLLAADRGLSDRLYDHAALALAADAVGGATRILELTVDYLKVRRQFDRPVGSFQALKHRCASWRVLQEAASALTAHAAQQVAAGAPEAASAASAAKYYACDAYAAIAGDAVQLHGGIGFTWDHDCHLYLKRAKLAQSLFGGGIAHRERVAAQVFPSYSQKRPRAADLRSGA